MSSRTLPSDQQRIDEENRKDEPDLQTMERAEKLSSQFEEIKQRTVEDDMVLGQVKGIETSPSSGTVVVSIDLPAKGEEKEKRFKKPRVWSDEYKLVRWMRCYGYDAHSLPNMLEDNCKVKVKQLGSSGKKYEVFVPEEPKGKTERLKRPVGKVKEWAKLTKNTYLAQDKPVISITGGIIHSIWAIAAISHLITVPVTGPQFFGLLFIGFICLGVLYVIELNKLPEKASATTSTW